MNMTCSGAQKDQPVRWGPRIIYQAQNPMFRFCFDLSQYFPWMDLKFEGGLDIYIWHDVECKHKKNFQCVLKELSLATDCIHK